MQHSSPLTAEIRFEQLSSSATLPSRAHDGDAGFDLAVPSDFGELMIEPGEFQTVGLELSVELPAGTVGLVCPRSGLAARSGVTVLNAPGIVDSGYRGELKVVLINHSKAPHVVSSGDRIAQLVVTPFFAPHSGQQNAAERGANGFGSTGH